jgi:YVTN family beta-propeller protein
MHYPVSNCVALARSVFPVVIVWLMSQGSVVAGEFQSLELLHAPTSMTIAEDGKQIYVAHDRDDLISVVETTTGKVLTTISTKRPVVMLARGDQLLVGNQGASTISVFSRSKVFEQTDEVQTGAPNMKWMSAPQGKFFKGWVLVTAEESQHVANLFFVNVPKDKHHTVGGKKVGGGVANVSYDGKFYTVQAEVWSGGTINEMRDFQAAIAGKESDSPKFDGSGLGLLYQAQQGPYWFGHTLICKGHPPLPFYEEPLGRITLPDSTKNVCYGIGPDVVKCFSLGTKIEPIGEQVTSFPKEYERMAEGADKPNQVQRYEYGFNDRHNVAATVDDKLCLYVFSEKHRKVYFNVTEPFDTSKAPAASDLAGSSAGSDVPNDSSADADSTSLPPKVQVGRKVVFKLQAPEGSTWELISGPKGAAITADGTLNWTPVKADAGAQQFKIRQKSGTKVQFVRLSTDVVDLSDLAVKSPPATTKPPKGRRPNQSSTRPSDPAPPTETPPADDTDLDDVGLHTLSDSAVGLSYSLDGSSLLVADGSQFMVLDKSGLTAVKTHEFESRYRQIFERPEYYVALAAKSIDLIDKKKLEVLKSIDVDYAQLNSMAMHPTKKLSYVGVMKPSEKDYVLSKPVLEVNEATGDVRVLPGVYGMWLAVDPLGKRLFTGLHQIYKDDLAFSLRDKFDHVDIVAAYDLTSDEPARASVNEQPGANGRRLVMSGDGKHVSYIAGGGAGGYGYAIASLAADDVSRESSRYQIEAYPQDIAYHPTLNLVACANGSKIWLFNRKTGEVESGRLDDRLAFKDIERLYFAPGGSRLMVAHKHPSRGPVLQAVPVKLNEKEEATASRNQMASGGSSAASEGAVVAAKSKVRVWSDKTGKFSIEAEHVSTTGNEAVLKRTNGKIVRVKIDLFSDEDQRLLRAHD